MLSLWADWGEDIRSREGVVVVGSEKGVGVVVVLLLLHDLNMRG